MNGIDGMLAYDPLLALILAGSFWVSGLAVLIGANPPSVAVSLAALDALAGLAIAGAPVANASVQTGRTLEYIWLSLLPIPFVWFFALFPSGISFSPRYRRWVRIYLWAATATGVTLPLMYSGVIPGPDYGVLRRAVLLLLGSALVAGVIMTVMKYMVVREQSQRNELGAIALGVGAGVLPMALLTALPVAFGHAPVVPPEWSAVATILVPASFGYAALRRDLLEIDWVLSYVLVYGVMLATFLSLYYLLNLAVPLLIPSGSGYWNAVITLTATAAALFSYQPGRRWLERQTYRCLFGEDYDFQAVLAAFGDLLPRVQPLDVLCQEAVERLGTIFNLTAAAVLMREHHGSWKEIAAWPSSQVLDRLPEVDPEHLTPRFILKLSAGMRIRLTSQGRTVAYLMLGPKAKGYRFGPRDAMLLRTLVPQLSVALENAILVDQLEATLKGLEIRQSELSRVRDVERQSLARDLHDGILQRLFYLKRLAEIEAASGRIAPDTSEQLVAGIQDAIAEVRALCAGLQPLALEEKRLADGLAILAEEVRKRWGLPVYVVLSPPGAGGDLDRRTELSLLLAAREMLSNTVRHARATEGYVYLEEERDELALSVWDDGQGFTVPPDLSSLVEKGHLGLANLEQRARELGGRLHIRSAPGEGSLVSLRIPRTGDSYGYKGSAG